MLTLLILRVNDRSMPLWEAENCRMSQIGTIRDFRVNFTAQMT